jgi:hypothetical protein
MPPSLTRHHEGASSDDLTPAELRLIPDGPFFLFPANLWPHKNHRRVLLARNIPLPENGEAVQVQRHKFEPELPHFRHYRSAHFRPTQLDQLACRQLDSSHVVALEGDVPEEFELQHISNVQSNTIVQVVPEPSGGLLLGAGVAGLAVLARRRRAQS